MPRYYFHLTDGKETVKNPEGMDLPGTAAAREEAMVLARDLKHGKVMPGRSWNGWSRWWTSTGMRSRRCRSRTSWTNKGPPFRQPTRRYTPCDRSADDANSR
jgi:hypothetical protein